jgi:cytidylate kinase
MARRVVCIARVLGSGADVVGRSVADALGFRYVDEEIVRRAADNEGVTVDDLVDAERRRSWLQRWFGDVALAGAAEGYMLGAAILPPTPSRERLQGLIQSAIHEAAEQGDLVIVSHAASFALARRDDVLRVLVTASASVRQARLVAAGAPDAADAAASVKHDDEARADYLKRFYDVRQELPTHYDLVISTDRLAPELAGELVVHAARAD